MTKERTNVVKKAEEAAAAEYDGLCATCASAPTCMYAREPERPVLECEEFAGFEVPAIKPASRRMALAAQTEPVEETDELIARGLCGNCENRASCTFSRPEGGIWQCEEYR
jgi:hypothetical protein